MSFHVMIDLETMSTRKNSAIVEIGAMVFEPRNRGRVYNDKVFHTFVKIQDGGGAIDNDTLAWWLQQPRAKELGQALEADTTPTLQVALDGLNKLPQMTNIEGFKSWEQVTGVWAKGPAFDLAIVESAYALFGARPPWHFAAERCCRTTIALAGGEGATRPDIQGLKAHHAGDDCLWQCMQIQKALTILNRSL